MKLDEMLFVFDTQLAKINELRSNIATLPELHEKMFVTVHLQTRKPSITISTLFDLPYLEAVRIMNDYIFSLPEVVGEPVSESYNVVKDYGLTHYTAPDDNGSRERFSYAEYPWIDFIINSTTK